MRLDFSFTMLGSDYAIPDDCNVHTKKVGIRNLHEEAFYESVFFGKLVLTVT